MNENAIVSTPKENWKVKVLTLGVLIGAAAGLTAAYLLIQRSERENKPPRLTAGEGVKLGALVFGLLRQVSQLGN